MWSTNLGFTVHKVLFVQYEGPDVSKNWNPKTTFLCEKKYFWGHFSHALLGWIHWSFLLYGTGNIMICLSLFGWKVNILMNSILCRVSWNALWSPTTLDRNYTNPGSQLLRPILRTTLLTTIILVCPHLGAVDQIRRSLVSRNTSDFYEL